MLNWVTSRPVLGFGLAGLLTVICLVGAARPGDASTQVEPAAATPAASPSSVTEPSPSATPIPGPPGPRGPRGKPGKSVTGPPGPSGSNGSDGTNGTNGQSITGPQGPRGRPGRTVTGPRGPVGPTGKPGRDGKDGKNGQRGRPGPPGPACPPGFTGQIRHLHQRAPDDDTTITVFVCVQD